MKTPERCAPIAILFCALGLSNRLPIQGTKASGDGTNDKYLYQKLHSYDFRSRPSSHGPPVNVSIGLDLISFHSVSESEMDWSAMVQLRQEWYEPRLKHNASINITVVGQFLDAIWVPDTFFKNAKQFNLQHSPKKNAMMQIRGDGHIYYSIRASLKSSCNMDLHAFPFDTQHCRERMSSYAYTREHIVYNWSPINGISINERLMLPQHSLYGWQTEEGFEKLPIGNASYVDVSFILERRLGFYLLQVYIPSAALVIIAWLSLWIDADVSSAARALFGITTILALVTQSSWLRSEIPKFAYYTALDIWLLACEIMVFLILLEFTFVCYLNTISRRRLADKCDRTRRFCEGTCTGKPARGSAELDVNVSTSSGADVNSLDRKRGSHDMCRRLDHMNTRSSHQTYYAELSAQSDRYSRLIFMLVFVTFNVFYWPIYTDIWTDYHKRDYL
ncbi:glycine receptor subunit alpha-2-like [Ptychodera flava]|uniref:glycine receptor subunit alpha-2-like n=1 Tax=Ptychodera flava TaxID=63121 RepID=UPI00396AAA19